jgi:ABC-type glycerol-3-phosphate transport system permease component
VNSAKRYPVELALLVATIIVIVPILLMMVRSVQPVREILAGGLPSGVVLDNYRALFGERSVFGQQLRNSVIIVAGSVALCLAIGLPAAYSLSKLAWRRMVTALLIALLVFIQLIPPMTLVPALYLTLVTLGLDNSLPGLILVHTVFHLPFVVLLLKVTFDAVPHELREAALVDGASEARTLRSVMLPVAAPGIAAAVIFAAILSWNDYLLGLTLTSGPEAAPLTVGIGTFVQPFNVRYGEMTAAGTLAGLPIVLLAVFAHRYIVSGLTGGAVK